MTPSGGGDERKPILATIVKTAERATEPKPRMATAFFGRSLPKRAMIRKLSNGRTGISQISVVISGQNIY